MSGNHATLLSGSYDSTTNGAAFGTPSRSRGAIFTLDVTSGTGTLDVSIQFYDAASGTWQDLYDGVQSTQVVFAQNAGSAATKFLTVAPGLTTTANKAFSQVLPGTLRAVATIGTGPFVCTLGVEYIRYE